MFEQYVRILELNLQNLNFTSLQVEYNQGRAKQLHRSVS